MEMASKAASFIVIHTWIEDKGVDQTRMLLTKSIDIILLLDKRPLMNKHAWRLKEEKSVANCKSKVKGEKEQKQFSEESTFHDCRTGPHHWYHRLGAVQILELETWTKCLQQVYYLRNIVCGWAGKSKRIEELSLFTGERRSANKIIGIEKPTMRKNLVTASLSYLASLAACVQNIPPP